ncbi:MAG: hypothetical protein Q9P01_15465 [Anaerolineae bacterium]|nr:hypothetical protein [Anaerolineae bacterium]
MMMHKRMILGLILFFSVLMPVMAQDNLLQNGGFDEEQYNLVSVSADGTQFNVPIAWGGVSIVQNGGSTWQNIQPNGFPHTFGFVHGGSRSYNISRGWATLQLIFTKPSPLPGARNALRAGAISAQNKDTLLR